MEERERDVNFDFVFREKFVCKGDIKRSFCIYCYLKKACLLNSMTNDEIIVSFESKPEITI